MLNSHTTVSEFIFTSVSAMSTRNYSLLSPSPDLEDVKGIHDFRVDIRRMKSVLKSCLTLLDQTWGDNYLNELRWVDEVISPIRNAQVLLDRFDAYSEPLRIRNKEILDSLRKDLVDCQSKLQLELNSLTFQQFLSYQNFEIKESIPTIHSNEPVNRYLKKFNTAAWRSLSKVAVKEGDDQLHKVRIKAKEVKYLAEASLPILGKSLKEQAKIASKVQISLGCLQDSLMMTAVVSSPEILKYEEKEQKQIKNDWHRFVKRNF